ncbi:glycosyltransferase [Coriobacterium glomerans]|nr:glycosyltransferase [Coriobacterium glomerans]
MKAAIVIPSYWADAASASIASCDYDHTIQLGEDASQLEACLASLDQVRGSFHVILLEVCAASATAEVAERIRTVALRHPALEVSVVTNLEASRIIEMVSNLVPGGTGECISLRGYGAIRNMGLAAAAVLGYDVVVFLDDDEVVLGPDFMDRALFALGQETRQRLPILAKTGYFLDRAGSPLADCGRRGPAHRWWTKRLEFNRWMRKALAGTRISRSNHVCGGCFAIHARAFTRVAFDPFITRGEDLDYLFNMRMQGLDVWFDNEWTVRHLPPRPTSTAPRFMQDVYRWYYEREKLACASRKKELLSVTAASLMPYPGPWISVELDQRVRKTAFRRALLTREHLAYWRIWRRGSAEATRYARENAESYLRFQSFWPLIMNRLWLNEELAGALRSA